MAGLATFQPAQAPGTPAQMAIQGGNSAQSWMDQAVARNIQQANEARQQQQFQVALPALVAKSAADSAVFNNQAASATIQQVNRAKYSAMIPQATQDLMDASDMSDAEVQQADGTPDWQAQYERLEGLQAKYAPLGTIPEGKPMLDAINAAAARAYQMATTQNTLQAHMKMTEDLVGGRQNVAQTNADARTQAATEMANARTQAAQILSQARLGVATIGAGSRNPADIISQLGTTADQYEQKAIDNSDNPTLSNGYMQLANLMRMKAQTYANPRGDMLLGTQGPQPQNTGSQGSPSSRGPSPFATSGALGGRAPTVPAAPSNSPPVVTTQEQYDALQPGQTFLDANGKPWTKPKGAQGTPAAQVGAPAPSESPAPPAQ
jgi:hypothetical protein